MDKLIKVNFVTSSWLANSKLKFIFRFMFEIKSYRFIDEDILRKFTITKNILNVFRIVIK